MKFSMNIFTVFVSLLVVSPGSDATSWSKAPYEDRFSRRLVTDSSYEGLDEVMKSSCIDQTYTVSLLTDSHISLVLEPNKNDVVFDGEDDNDTPLFHKDNNNHKSSSWCDEMLMMHMDGANKVVMTVEGSFTTNKPLLPLLNNVSLKTLMNAFQQSEIGLDTVDDYDIIDQNCATFVLDMMNELNIPVDDRVMLYTVERLYENGKTVEALKKSDKLNILLEGANGVTADSPDEQLLALLVDKYVHNHRESKNGFVV